jgi:hypothetical protein
MSKYFVGNFSSRTVFQADKNGTPIRVCEARTKAIAAKIEKSLNQPKLTSRERDAIAAYNGR